VRAKEAAFVTPFPSSSSCLSPPPPPFLVPLPPPPPFTKKNPHSLPPPYSSKKKAVYHNHSFPTLQHHTHTPPVRFHFPSSWGEKEMGLDWSGVGGVRFGAPSLRREGNVLFFSVKVFRSLRIFLTEGLYGWGQ